MTSAMPLIWDLAGRPEPTGKNAASGEAAPCALCGRHVDRTADINRVLGSSFTDRGHLARLDSDRACAACVWCCTGRGLTSLRLWTVVAHPGAPCESQPKAWIRDTPGLTLTNRAHTAPVTALLDDPPDGPWALSVAVSAQKQVVPYARLNHGRAWTVRFEATDITATSADWSHVHGAALALRRLGVPEEAIVDGEPRFVTGRDRLALWRDLDAALAGWRRSPLLRLALWTITKKETSS